jgi:hypothetical protein
VHWQVSPAEVVVGDDHLREAQVVSAHARRPPRLLDPIRHEPPEGLHGQVEGRPGELHWPFLHAGGEGNREQVLVPVLLEADPPQPHVAAVVWVADVFGHPLRLAAEHIAVPEVNDGLAKVLWVRCRGGLVQQHEVALALLVLEPALPRILPWPSHLAA